MLAELSGKLDPDATTAVERREDLLTDAVFGSLRYLPPTSVLGAVLAAVGVFPSRQDLVRARIMLWPRLPMPGWPGKSVEPDVVITAGKHVAVFEAKLSSPFGHDLEPGTRAPVHQLAMQYVAVSSWAAGEALYPPVVVAVTPLPVAPDEQLRQAARDVARLQRRPSAAAAIIWLPWQAIAERLAHFLAHDGVTLRRHEQQLITDVLNVMESRGVRRVFTGVRPEDYYLLTAATRVAADWLYPQLRTFFDDLTAILKQDGIGYSQPNWKGMWLGGESTSVSKPASWTRNIVGLQYWPSWWPSRLGKIGGNTALYVLFDLHDPAVEVGLTVQGPGVAAAQAAWEPHIQDLASYLVDQSLYEVVVDLGDVARPTQTQQTAEVTVEWLGSLLGLLTGQARLRLRRRADAFSVTVQQAREIVHEVVQTVHQSDTLWRMLIATGHVRSAPGPLPPGDHFRAL